MSDEFGHFAGIFLFPAPCTVHITDVASTNMLAHLRGSQLWGHAWLQLPCALQVSLALLLCLQGLLLLQLLQPQGTLAQAATPLLQLCHVTLEAHQLGLVHPGPLQHIIKASQGISKTVRTSTERRNNADGKIKVGLYSMARYSKVHGQTRCQVWYCDYYY